MNPNEGVLVPLEWAQKVNNEVFTPKAKETRQSGRKSLFYDIRPAFLSPGQWEEVNHYTHKRRAALLKDNGDYGGYVDVYKVGRLEVQENRPFYVVWRGRWECLTLPLNQNFTTRMQVNEDGTLSIEITLE